MNPADVTLRMQGHPGGEVTCVDVDEWGTYDCDFTPQFAGDGLAFALLVNGTLASRIYDDDGVIKYDRGPWEVDVKTGVVSAANSVLTGVRTTYTAGVAANAILLLKGTYGNNLGPVSAWPVIEAYLTDGAPPYVMMDPFVDEWSTKDGALSVATAFNHLFWGPCVPE